MTETKNNKFRLRMKELRENAGYKSQAAFGKVYGVAQSTVGGWESGKREPEFDELIRLTEFFNCSADYLIGISSTSGNDSVWTHQHIIDCRKKSGYSVQTVADAVGVSPQYIFEIEDGKTAPSIDVLVKLADLYCSSVDHLLGRVFMPYSLSKNDLTAKESQLINAYNSASDEVRKIMDGIVDSYIHSDQKKAIG